MCSSQVGAVTHVNARFHAREHVKQFGMHIDKYDEVVACV